MLVDVEAAGINFPDVLTIAGQYQVKASLPFVPGNEGAGIVSVVGPGVTQFATGDKVIFTTRGGAFAEKCVADVHSMAPLPDDLNWGQVLGVSFACGIGFTMSLFIAGLAFEHGSGAYFSGDRLGILVGSMMSALAAFVILHMALPRGEVADNEPAEARPGG